MSGKILKNILHRLQGVKPIVEEPIVEERLLDGSFRPKIGRPSVALFTLHKAGSSFLSERLAPLHKKAGYAVADFEHYLIRLGTPQSNPFEEETTCRRIFSAQGVFHKAIRQPIHPDWLGETKVLLVTRDPRDMVTSYYFSLKYSHVVSSPDVLEQRRSLENKSIDQFVLESELLETMMRRLEAYRAYFHLGHRFLHLSYETMVTQPAIASAQVTSFLGLTSRRAKVFSADDFTVSSEDVMSHRRQILPGDHARKLAPETIRRCNERIRPLASFYGWQNVD